MKRLPAPNWSNNLSKSAFNSNRKHSNNSLTSAVTVHCNDLSNHALWFPQKESIFRSWSDLSSFQSFVTSRDMSALGVCVSLLKANVQSTKNMLANTPFYLHKNPLQNISKYVPVVKMKCNVFLDPAFQNVLPK